MDSILERRYGRDADIFRGSIYEDSHSYTKNVLRQVSCYHSNHENLSAQEYIHRSCVTVGRLLYAASTITETINLGLCVGSSAQNDARVCWTLKKQTYRKTIGEHSERSSELKGARCVSLNTHRHLWSTALKCLQREPSGRLNPSGGTPNLPPWRAAHSSGVVRGMRGPPAARQASGNV